MITVSLQEAKTKLPHLVQKARAGEQVVFLQGSKVVATLLPLSSNDLEITPILTEDQAEKFWEEVSTQPQKKFKSPQSTLRFLKRMKS